MVSKMFIRSYVCVCALSIRLVTAHAGLPNAKQLKRLQKGHVNVLESVSQGSPPRADALALSERGGDRDINNTTAVRNAKSEATVLAEQVTPVVVSDVGVISMSRPSASVGMAPSMTASVGHHVTTIVVEPSPHETEMMHETNQHQETLAQKPLVAGIAIDRDVRFAADGPNTMVLRGNILYIVLGVILSAVGIAIQWFNEIRSARVDSLFSRGLAECLTVVPPHARSENRGKLIHVQGRTSSTMPAQDAQFVDACVTGCLKLQSTVEVFEWVQTTRKLEDGKEQRIQPRFHTEWTTMHRDSLRFRKPSPENPRLPTGLLLGTFTETSKRVTLGDFILSDESVTRFHKFEPADKYLPKILNAHGLAFIQNPDDGYYYSRPGAALHRVAKTPDWVREHLVGDVRARFLCVAEGDATVVGVQCEREPGVDGFVPYRSVPRAPCLTQERQRTILVEEGDRPLKDSRYETTCCTSGAAGCCCCACNVISGCCNQEVVTEEILWVHEGLAPAERAFEHVVRRSPWRVWSYRSLGLGLVVLGATMIFTPLHQSIVGLQGLTAYGAWAGQILAFLISICVTATVVASAYARFMPLVAFYSLVVEVLFIAATLVYGTWG